MKHMLIKLKNLSVKCLFVALIIAGSTIKSDDSIFDGSKVLQSQYDKGNVGIGFIKDTNDRKAYVSDMNFIMSKDMQRKTSLKNYLDIFQQDPIKYKTQLDEIRLLLKNAESLYAHHFNSGRPDAEIHLYKTFLKKTDSKLAEYKEMLAKSDVKVLGSTIQKSTSSTCLPAITSQQSGYADYSSWVKFWQNYQYQRNYNKYVDFFMKSKGLYQQALEAFENEGGGFIKAKLSVKNNSLVPMHHSGASTMGPEILKVSECIPASNISFVRYMKEKPIITEVFFKTAALKASFAQKLFSGRATVSGILAMPAALAGGLYSAYNSAVEVAPVIQVPVSPVSSSVSDTQSLMNVGNSLNRFKAFYENNKAVTVGVSLGALALVGALSYKKYGKKISQDSQAKVQTPASVVQEFDQKTVEAIAETVSVEQKTQVVKKQPAKPFRSNYNGKIIYVR